MPPFTSAYSSSPVISAAIAAHFRDARRLEREVARVLRRHAINGGQYADDSPPIGTLRQELRIVALLGELPRDLQRHPEATRMLRAALLSDEPSRRLAVYP